MRQFAAVLAVLALSTGVAEADSDGSFCVGRGYLAYEMRFSKTPYRHELHVVRFGTATGIVVAPPVVLDDFQVHGMICHSATVELLGWSTAYSVDISDKNRPKTTSRSAPFDSSGTPVMNLGHSAQARVIDLDAGGATVFQLVIAHVSQPVAGGIEHHIVSRLIQRGPSGPLVDPIVASLKLFEGVRREPAN